MTADGYCTYGKHEAGPQRTFPLVGGGYICAGCEYRNRDTDPAAKIDIATYYAQRREDAAIERAQHVAAAERAGLPVDSPAPAPIGKRRVYKAGARKGEFYLHNFFHANLSLKAWRGRTLYVCVKCGAAYTDPKHAAYYNERVTAWVVPMDAI